MGAEFFLCNLDHWCSNFTKI